jgi:hypothetical protein
MTTREASSGLREHGQGSHAFAREYAKHLPPELQMFQEDLRV